MSLHFVHDSLASDIETCKRVSASLGSHVILNPEGVKNPVTEFTGSFALLRMTMLFA